MPDVKCVRCSQPMPPSGAEAWLGLISGGRFMAALCDVCTTDEEHVEAQVNAALFAEAVVSGRVPVDGLLIPLTFDVEQLRERDD